MTNEMSSGQVYTKLGDRLKLLPAQIINAWLDGKGDEQAKPFILKALYALVYVLAFASVVNISTRAATHHAGWMSYIFGAGFALVVPATVFIAAHFPGLTSGARFYAWFVAVIAAMMSMFIQIKVYMTGADLSLSMLLSGDVDLEALAFSAGIPFFEVLMASLAAIVSGAHESYLASIELAQSQKVAQQKADDEAEAERKHQAELLRQREEDERTFERRKQEAQLRAYEAKLAQEAELAREKALADLRIKEQKAAVKMSVKSAGANGVKSSGSNGDFTPDFTGDFTPKNAEERRVVLRNILYTELDGKPIEELNKSALARRLSVTRPTINTDLESLIATGELSLNGHVVVKK